VIVSCETSSDASVVLGGLRLSRASFKAFLTRSSTFGDGGFMGLVI
jgi:hypothetical protein